MTENLVSRHVHLRGVVRPGAERQVAFLFVERVVSDVDLTHGLEDSARLPAQRAVRAQHRLEFIVALVDRLRSGGKMETSAKTGHVECQRCSGIDIQLNARVIKRALTYVYTVLYAAGIE